MNFILQEIEKYHPATKDDYVNALREIVQEIALFALSKTDFFEHACFCGGTALRIFYGLNRASEDLDFSLMKRNIDFDLNKYASQIEKIFLSFGFQMTFVNKKDIGAVKSAFLKGNTITNLFSLNVPKEISNHIPSNSVINVKLEVDTNPPAHIETEYKVALFPYAHNVRMMKLSSLFARKIHALLCRSWIKGRDYYDYLFYLRKGSEINYPYLNEALKQVNHLAVNNSEELKNMLCSRFSNVDFEEVKKDCRRFLVRQDEIDDWNQELFINATKQYL